MNHGEIEPQSQSFKKFAVMVRNDFHDAWEATRASEPIAPIVRELLDDWRTLRETCPAEPGDRIASLVLRGAMMSHTAYHNITDRRIRFGSRLHGILSFLEIRASEHGQHDKGIN